MPDRSAQSLRADPDTAATQAAKDAASNANAAASDAVTIAEDAADKAVSRATAAADKAKGAADKANEAAERHLQVIDTYQSGWGRKRLVLAIGDGLNPQKQDVSFMGQTYKNSLVTFTYPA